MKHVWTRSEQEEELDTPRSNMTRSHFLGVVSTRVQALVTSYMRASVAQSDREQTVHRLYFLKEVHFVKDFKELRNMHVEVGECLECTNHVWVRGPQDGRLD